jgi:uncharacterized DUF497 family protein
VNEEFDGFDWSEWKRSQNLEKHNIDFPIVETVDWARIRKAPDARRRYNEPRSVALAYSSKLRRVLVIVYSKRDRIGRIISVRRANAEETSIFYAGSR